MLNIYTRHAMITKHFKNLFFCKVSIDNINIINAVRLKHYNKNIAFNLRELDQSPALAHADEHVPKCSMHDI